MDPEDMMPVDLDLASMWTLSEDSTEVRLALPPIALEGLPKPLELFVDFDAKAVDQCAPHGEKSPGGLGDRRSLRGCTAKERVQRPSIVWPRTRPGGVSI